MWRHFVAEKLGREATLLSVSRYSSNRRVYRCDDRIYKIRRIASELYERQQDLAGEHHILSKLEGLRGVCRNVEYHTHRGWEMLSYDYVPGRCLLSVINEGKDLLTGRIVWRVLRALWAVHKRGVAHRDITFDNILLCPSGEVLLMDFDQAIEMPPARAHLMDFLDVKFEDRAAIHPFERTLRQHYRPWYLLIYPLVRLRRAFRKAAGWLLRTEAPDDVEDELPPEDPKIELLQRAWQIARASDANAPGAAVAYYSLDVMGHHFFGERPWALRWEQVAGRVKFRGKRVLELGCNLGLFSAFAARAGAHQCLAVDRDKRILQGARLVAQALDAAVEHRRVDLNSAGHWEQELAGFDMVIAMSVANWVRDRPRLLHFLGLHQELLYEGHGPLGDELHRLRSAGFTRIEVLGISERDRPVYYARRSGRQR